MSSLKSKLIGLLVIFIIAGAIYALGNNNPIVTAIQSALAPLARGS
jgi:hypothetical protein